LGSSNPQREGTPPPPNRVELTRPAFKQLAALPGKVQRQIGAAIDQLRTNARPPGSQKLQGADDLYRVYSGSYRIIYSIAEPGTIVVTIIRIGHRKDVYRNL
jgi:mRNA interferase RelE/StbE